MASKSSLGGIIPASDSLLAGTNTMNFIAISPLYGRRTSADEIDTPEKFFSASPLSPGPARREVIPIHPCDHFQFDLLRTNRFAFADVGAVAKALGGRLHGHRQRTLDRKSTRLNSSHIPLSR